MILRNLPLAVAADSSGAAAKPISWNSPSAFAMDAQPPRFISQAPPNIAGWMAMFDVASLPVLAETAAAIEEWRANEDAVDAQLLAESIGHDPLMTLKLFAHVAQACKRRAFDDERGNVETVTSALVLLGIGPFFRTFGPQPVVEQELADWPEALEGLQRVLRRSYRASAFAIGFAAHRLDPDAAMIHAAALLHDFSELLLWLRAPALALELSARQQADATLRSAPLQRALLHVELPALQHALMVHWRLPALLIRLADDECQVDDQVRNVTLAVRLARHTANGWGNAAVPDDIHDIADMLNLSLEPTRHLLMDIDNDA